MYATLAHNPSSTVEQILADIVAVITGETDLNNLSSVAVASSELNTTTAAGWTLWDDVSATQKVVRQVVSDDPTKHKYLLFKTSGNNVYMNTYRDWDNVAHTGNQWLSFQQDQGASQFNDRYIASASSEYGTVTCVSSSATHYASQHLYNNEQSLWYPVLVSEHTRDSAWDTVANGYVPVALSNGSNSSPSTMDRYFCLPNGPIDAGTDWDNVNTTYYNHSTASLTTINSIVTASEDSASVVPFRPVGLDANKNEALTLVPLRVVGNSGYHQGGDLTSKCNIWMIGAIGATFNTRILASGAEYRVWPINTTNAAASPARSFAVKV